MHIDEEGETDRRGLERWKETGRGGGAWWEERRRKTMANGHPHAVYVFLNVMYVLQ